MRGFDFSQIEVPVFLEELGIRNIHEQEDEVNFSCPFPEHSAGDETPSAYMNQETTAYFCHGCKRKGNAIRFLAELENFSVALAARFIEERFGGGFQAPVGGLQREIEEFFMEKGKPESPLIPLDIDYKLFTVDWINYREYEEPLVAEALGYMMARGFSCPTLNFFDIGLDVYAKRITIPLYEEHGRLVGIKGRAIDKDRKPKYMVIGDRKGKPAKYGFPCYSPARVVFAIDKVKPGQVILCEGELNAMAMWQMGYKNTVAIGGSTFSDDHARIIRQVAESVVLFFDADQAGSKVTEEAIKKLQMHMPVFLMPEVTSDAGDMLLEKSGKELVHNFLDRKINSIEISN